MNADMMIRRLSKSVVSFAVVLVALTCLAKDASVKAPDFTTETLEGQQIQLSSYQGKVVLVDFWASWCGPCRKEMPFLVEQYSEKKDQGFIVLAVNLDKETKNIQKFLSNLEKRPGFPVVRDPNETICPLYKLEGMPTSILIDRQGKMRFRHQGFKEETRDELVEEIDLLISEKGTKATP